MSLKAESQRAIFWLVSPGRENLKQSLVLDLASGGLAVSSEDVDELHMRVIQTLRRIAIQKNVSRIDLRKVSRGVEAGLLEVRWDFSVEANPLLLRLFLAEGIETSSLVAIRFFRKTLQQTREATNALQDEAIDAALEILQNIGKSPRLVPITQGVR